MEIYNASLDKGASHKGAILVVSQAALESSYGKVAIKYGDYNLFGVMGYPSKRKTSHGSVKDFSKSGKYKGAISDYFDGIDRKWPDFIKVIKREDFSYKDVDEAFHTGDYYPTDEQRHNGIYAYNADKDANGKNNYGDFLVNQMMPGVDKRFMKSLNYKINENNSRISYINTWFILNDNNLLSNPLTNSQIETLGLERIELIEQNIKMNNIINNSKQ